MTIEVLNAADQQVVKFTGTPEQLVSQLDTYYSWLKRYESNGLQDMISHLNRQQMFFVKVYQ